jgi:membrane protease YdiL (CAAX protease family)
VLRLVRRAPAGHTLMASPCCGRQEMEDGAPAWSPRADIDPRRGQLLEVLVFLFLIVPSMLLSFLVVRQGGLGFVVTAWATIGRDLGLVSLIVFFLWRNGEPVGRIGWTLKNGGREALLGLGLFGLLFVGTIVLESLLRSAGVPPPATPRPRFLTATGPAELGLAVALVTVVAVAEETIFRGYLILRFSAVTRRPVVAALLSAIVFSLGHGYEGTTGVITVGVMGLGLAVVYLWRRSLLAPIVMHFLQDFIGIILLPLLGSR